MQKDKFVKLTLVAILVIVCGTVYCTNINDGVEITNDSESVLLEEDIEYSIEDEKEESVDTQAIDSKDNTINEVENVTIYVYVCGQVEKPGVYQLEQNARIYEAIEAAGGINEEGSKEYLNQAQVVQDGDRIFVPSIEEVELMNMDIVQTESNADLVQEASNGSQNTNLVNINTASDSELMKLPGIGQSKADKIIAYRESNGGFNSIEDIMQITGIKEGVYNKIKDLITVK